MKYLIYATAFLLGAFTFTGCTNAQKAQSPQILKQATYEWDSIRPAVYSGYNTFDGDRWHPVVWHAKPNGSSSILHLEVVAVPTGGYDLRGWHVYEWTDSLGKNHHNRAEILSGVVSDNAVPHSITWQTPTMGEPNHVWTFYFSGADLKPGDLIIQDRNQIFRYHQVK